MNFTAAFTGLTIALIGSIPLSQLPASAQRSLTASEKDELCASTAPHAVREPFGLTPEGVKRYFSGDGWGAGVSIKVIEVGKIKRHSPAENFCLSNSVYVYDSFARITDPRGSRVCKVKLKWEGSHASSRDADGTLNFDRGKGATFREYKNSCRWD